MVIYFKLIEYKRIYISRTAKEWELIDKRIKDLNKSNIHSFLRSSLSRLEKDFNICEHCICSSVGPNMQRQIYIAPEQFEILNKISIVSELPEGIIVNQLIIQPLLNNL